MARPSEKAPALAELFERMTGRSTSITENICVRPPIGCGGDASKFKDARSQREYTISGLCQKCQDEIFGY